MATLDNISKILASSTDGGGYLEKIHKQLDSQGASRNDPFMGFKVPALTDIAKGLTFGLAPGLIKKSVAGMQVFINALNNIAIPDAEASIKIAKVIKDFSDAIITFGEIKWSSAFKGTFLLKMFADKFVSIGEVLGSPANLLRLEPFRKFAARFGTPLKLIGDALQKFSGIKWAAVFASAFLLKKIMARLETVSGNIAGNNSLFIITADILEKLGKGLGDFFESFGKLKFTKMLVGSLLFETVFKTLVAISKLASDNSSSFEKFGEVLKKLNEPLKNFAETFDKIGNGLIKASLSLLIVAGSLGLAAISLKLFAGMPEDAIKLGLGTFVVMMGAVAVLSKFATDAIKGAAALAIVAASLGVAALSLMLFKLVNWPEVGMGMVALASIVGALALVGAVMASPGGVAILTGAGALALIGLAMIPFAAGMAILGTINYKNFDGIFGAIASLAGGAALLTLAIPGMLAFAIAGIPFALSLKILSTIQWSSFDGIFKALKRLASGVEQLSAFKMLKAGLAMVPFAAGIVALRLAIAVGGNKIPEFLESFNKGLKDLDGPGLISAAKGILTLSGALVAFAGAQVVAGIGNLIGKILRFGGDSPIEQLIKLAKHGYNLSILGTGVKDLANGLKTLTGINSELDILETLADKFKSFSNSLDPTGIKAFASGLNMLVGALQALSQLDGKLGVLNQIPYDALSNLTSSAQPGSPLIQIVNGLKESSDSQQTAQLLKQSIASKPPTVGEQLGNSGSTAAPPVVIINNSNSGGNVTNNSSSNVNNNGSVNTPIITASGSGMFTAE